MGLPEKAYYTTGDVCSVLGIQPDTFRARIRAGFYQEPLRVGKCRIFSEAEIRNILNRTNKLNEKGTLKSGINKD